MRRLPTKEQIAYLDRIGVLASLHSPACIHTPGPLPSSRHPKAAAAPKSSHPKGHAKAAAAKVTYIATAALRAPPPAPAHSKSTAGWGAFWFGVGLVLSLLIAIGLAAS